MTDRTPELPGLAELLVALGEALESAGIDHRPSQLRAVAAELTARYGGLLPPAPQRAAWRRWEPEELAEARRLLASGLSFGKTAEKLGRSRRSLTSALDREEEGRG